MTTRRSAQLPASAHGDHSIPYLCKKTACQISAAEVSKLSVGSVNYLAARVLKNRGLHVKKHAPYP